MEDGRRVAVSSRRNFIRVGGNRRSDLGYFIEFDETGDSFWNIYAFGFI
jgi:hypothetical protein